MLNISNNLGSGSTKLHKFINFLKDHNFIDLQADQNIETLLDIGSH